MALYICPKCQTAFNEPFREHYDDGALKEDYDTCPTCGNADFEPAFHCKGCNRDTEYGALIAGEYCEDCVKEAIMESGSDIVYEFLAEPDVRESFAEFLAERRWRPGRKAEG